MRSCIRVAAMQGRKAHGAAWKRFVDALSAAFDVGVFLCTWELQGHVANNFAQSSDKAAADRVNEARLREAYPANEVELVSTEYWVDTDAWGNDGRYLNQWRMVRRCWQLMERSWGDADFVVRSRPDVRAACLPRRLERGRPYVALQDELWGSDAFIFGDAKSMHTVCALDAKYDEYTSRLGHASSELMLQLHVRESELYTIYFPRCVGIDRS